MAFVSPRNYCGPVITLVGYGWCSSLIYDVMFSLLFCMSSLLLYSSISFSNVRYLRTNAVHLLYLPSLVEAFTISSSFGGGHSL